ncbi:tetraspanin-7-like [Silene latifolia]|uniref:tetraspanin-7-like n=1 Tax=Silene latifolia TaxID=37657 RepID=UPI003D7729C1
MGVSTCVLGCLNTFTLCLSLPILLAGFLLRITANSPCDPIMYKPLLAIGLSLLIVSLIGLLGACCRVSIFQWLYLFTLFILIIGLLALLSVSGVLIKGGGKGNDVMGGVKEYELPMFSNWLKKNFVSDDHWEDVVNCLVHHDACGKISTFRTLMDFVTYKKSKLTSMEMGCCKPPVHCGYEYKSNTRWEVPEQGLASQDADCKAWSNDPDKLCYNCETCKGGYLAFFVKGWKKITALNTALLVILFFVFIIAACALR